MSFETTPSSREDFYVLTADAALLEERIADLNGYNLILAQAIEEAIGQSSETTHDNAPYDAVIHEKYITDKRLAEFNGIKAKMTVIEPPTDPIVTVPGTNIKLESESGEMITVELAGHWHDRHTDSEDTLVVSLDSPIGQKLIGLAVGSVVQLSPPENSVVISIESSAGEYVDLEDATERNEAHLDEDWKASRVLFVAGPTLSGKTAVIEKLSAVANFSVFEVNDILRSRYVSEGVNTEFNEWLARLSNDEVAKIVSGHITAELDGRPIAEHEDGIIIVGSKTSQDIDNIRESLDAAESRLIYLNASKSMLHERFKQQTLAAKKRPTKQDKEQAEQAFSKILERDTMNLFRLADRADLKLLNMGTVEEATSKILEFIADWNPADD